MELTEHIKGILNTLPDKPGCYLMKDETGKIIYVGKAINLKNRVRSYFHVDAGQSYKTRKLVRRISDIETIIVGSELEALILEMNLIKLHRPFFNVRLKDDKRYPYIKVHWADDFPKISVTREMIDDGSRYFGPYTSAWAYRSLDVLRHIFPYCTCAREITGDDVRPCLTTIWTYARVPALAVSKGDYRDDRLSLQVLEGKTNPVLKNLTDEMMKASEVMNYEKAAAIATNQYDAATG